MFLIYKGSYREQESCSMYCIFSLYNIFHTLCALFAYFYFICTVFSVDWFTVANRIHFCKAFLILILIEKNATEGARI